MKKRKEFNIERVKEFCKLVNEGNTPSKALRLMNSCDGYINPLHQAGLYWKENDGTYKAVERIHMERYLLFTKKKNEYNELKNLGTTKLLKQPTLFNQPKPKQPTAQKVKQPKLNFIQRVVKSLFNL